MAYLNPAGPYIPDTGYGAAPEGSPMDHYRKGIIRLMEEKRLQHAAEFGAMYEKHGPVLKRGDTLDPVLASHLHRKTY